MGGSLKIIYDESDSIGNLEYIPQGKSKPIPPKIIGYESDFFNLLIKTTSEFSKNEIEPGADKRDEIGAKFIGGKIVLPSYMVDGEKHNMEELYSKIAKIGLTRLGIPKEYGGLGLSYKIQCIATELLSKKDASIGVSHSIHNSCAGTIAELATKEVKRKYLNRLANGEWGAIALTESEAGSDVGAVRTTAILENDHYVANGEKVLISNAGWADQYILLACTDRTKAKKTRGKDGLSIFILEKDFDGFKVDGIEKKVGMRASPTGTIVLENCEIPKENLLGKEGRGYYYTTGRTLAGGRVSIASQAVGLSQAAYESASKYARERVQFGRSLEKIPAVSEYLSFMRDCIGKSRFLYLNAADRKDKEKDKWNLDASEAKLFATECASMICKLAIQIHGGYGCTTGFPVERYWRDAKAPEIYEGASEVQDFIIRKGRGRL